MNSSNVNSNKGPGAAATLPSIAIPESLKPKERHRSPLQSVAVVESSEWQLTGSISIPERKEIAMMRRAYVKGSLAALVLLAGGIVLVPGLLPANRAEEAKKET